MKTQEYIYVAIIFLVVLVVANHFGINNQTIINKNISAVDSVQLLQDNYNNITKEYNSCIKTSDYGKGLNIEKIKRDQGNIFVMVFFPLIISWIIIAFMILYYFLVIKHNLKKI